MLEDKTANSEKLTIIVTIIIFFLGIFIIDVA
jgi:hypothetical protein